ncbi:M14 family zinc carboxypeptidase [Neolewinella antarctica]|uniref:Peptidase M14 domain-containing protein n=1 Tax=Neolewinella antarctica TaxID=442734 RepID=A0ABX0XD63_9BACT|nr:M14 family zinc carboxypeptidase [Neolewinella antarctica]NJC26848.1 hypothetical protein [Neolewinella antarctica]
MKSYLLSLLLLPILFGGVVRAQVVLSGPTIQLPKVRIVPHNEYPTYGEYVSLMERFADLYPDVCELEDWGTLPSGRRILTLRITKDIATTAGKPKVLCTAAMHGDELAGYWLMLQLAEDLLRHDRTRLLDDLEIYINPLANPDGAYHHNDRSLARSRRGNANGVDLNRNYPDPDDGAHPDGQTYQPETQIFMRAARSHGFDLALNVHGGAEVFNYPWDTYRNRHPDNVWWRRVSREFAQRAQIASGRANYFDDRQNGVTNGHDWYPIAGSRQDYMNYYHRCREATLEVSDVKRFPAGGLAELWTFVRTPIYGYLNEARNGLHGFVIDDLTGQPIAANVIIPDHDHQNSDVIADRETGDFHRYLTAGTYEVKFSAAGYLPQLRTVVIHDDRRVDMNVRLRRASPGGIEARRK